MKEFFKTNYLLFIKTILTIYALYSLKYLYRLKNIESEFYMNITFIFIIAGVYLLISYSINMLKQGIEKKLLIIAVCMGLYFALAAVIGTYYEGASIVIEPKQQVQFKDFTLLYFKQSLVYIPALWFMCFGIILAIYLKIPQVYNKYIKEYNDVAERPKIFNKLYKVWIFIFICWLSYFILLYPGYTNPDFNAQINQVFTGKFNTHHPLLTTFTHYFTMGIYKLTNNGVISLASYVLIFQIIPLSFAFAYMLYKISYLFKISNIMYILLILYGALFLVHPLSSLVIMKDVLFYILFILFITDTLLLVYSTKLIQNKFFMIKYIILAVVFCLVRNNVIYGLIFSLPFILFFAKNYRKKVILIFTLVIVFFYFTDTAFIKITNANKGDFRESLSLPIQQLARVYKYQFENLSVENKKYIESIININGLKNYNPNLSDPVKSSFNTGLFLKKENVLKYFEIGLQYPTTYLNSVLIMSSPLWNLWCKTYKRSFVSDLYCIDINFLSLTKEQLMESKNKIVHNYVTKVDYITTNSSFIYFYIFNQATFFYILLFSFLYFIYKKEYKNVIVLLIPLGYTITVLLGPVVYLRYTYYLMAIFPMLIMMLAARNNGEINLVNSKNDVDKNFRHI